ncbi:MAG: ribonuclease Y [Ignavibacteria bacterium RIFOXYB2_FULL_35_12]|nr:MAG: ribonuclease Y [Ignavibacteria bacterium GWA2_36_19]OGU50670.1 MAG: ribonuclease Y [Ignavibacteria bacterium GWC2_35_8]OGU60355.1 MAG: ribonuclease Y [Ignavibacteria bacterium GWF2_35_20]OGU81454.1 MAG: ribonuclease Y [Ignavibacteria bacterium RIFOXYA2_FULL_35_9]OGU90444.1 MAG: ribonuclease Y [Ignavibacteria bacterium RIFOXYA12_FULL_35_25]OGU92612.1 MAG: ribonuclease Y [Ignavibacteria bacterium RIFOXYC12_FULL_35_11]OGU94273.1 MAG: ribonuclease Y [Ignavibacteria bacterium RIFOXYB12_FUL
MDVTNISLVVLIPTVIFLIVLFFFLGWYLNTKVGKKSLSAAEEKAKQIINDAQKESQNLKREKLLEVKDEWYKKKLDFDNDLNQKKQKYSNIEKQLSAREENIEKKFDLVLKKEKENRQLERELLNQKKDLDTKLVEIQKHEAEQNEKLEKISGLSKEEAKRMLMENLVDVAKSDSARLIKNLHDKAKADAKKDAQKIIVQAIQRTAADYAVETTVSVVQIQSDEMKGRIIGKEGRNIRSFEAVTGVDVIVDDTPEAVILSSFDQFRREVARLSLERLIADGRIHPARIEEVVEKVRQELEEEMIHEGENTLMQLGIHNMHAELVKCIGRMRYRSSFGQNLLQHSVEVSYLTGIMAAELGLDVTLAKRAGLLHDVGKTLDKSIEGPHALLGYDLTKKFKEHPIVVNAVGSHHEDIEMEHPIAPLVQAADAISGARPGARREPLESYVKRLETLEALAKSFEGVAKTYAIQAGREIRVVVEHDKVDDSLADRLASEIAAKIENEMEYPGQIKVTVIREVRKISYAK